jgi:hypothetical protein
MSVTALPPPAFLLPRSPAAAVLLILVALAVTYALLNVFVRVGVSADAREMPAAAEAAPPIVPDEPAAPEAATAPMEQSGATDPVVQAVCVRGIALSVGDTSSHVMRAFRAGEGERLPLIERLPGGMASRVIRCYAVGTRALVIMLERSNPEEPLRMTRIEVQGG